MSAPNLATDLGFGPEFPISTPGGYQSDYIRFKDGTTQSWYEIDDELRQWSLRYRVNDTQFQALEAFYEARRGAYEQFYWNHPVSGESDIPVKFAKGQNFTKRWVSPAVREVNLLIIEVKL